MKNRYLALPLVAAALSLAACGSTHARAGSNAPANVPASPSPVATLACSTVLPNGQTASQEISKVVQDQVSQDQSMTQNWVDLVSGSLTSQGNDLQQAASAFQAYPAGSSPLATAGQQLSTDVFTFSADQESGLQPGWVPEYRAIQHDIAVLGGLCGTPYSLPSGE